MGSQLSDVDALEKTRLRVTVRGAVQGVGFRPFVFRLATESGLKGWVNNSPQGVFIEVEGARPILNQFLLRLESERPPRSFIQSLEATWLDPTGYTGFEIRPSDTAGEKTALVLPDIATCPECLSELFDPANRRYFYPFTNCTHCGPRFSIIRALPYDRANTSMHSFVLCPECQAEYEDPQDRRFHAQPNACPACGPRLALWDDAGRDLSGSGPQARDLLVRAAEQLKAGKILAVKGLGGFHLMVSAQDDQAVQRLRRLKHREEKPFALMFPSLETIEAVCEVSPLERRLLRSPEAPIVLLRRKPLTQSRTGTLSPEVAPGNPYLGIMLPYTPLHHLLLALFERPVVATSGNLSDEPICIDEHEAGERLAGIADLFLLHNRPIVRHVDDSIVRLMAGREMVLRRARGYAPLPFAIQPSDTRRPCVLGVGAHLKSTVALSSRHQVFISQHIGDLETDQAFSAFGRAITDLETLFELEPEIIAADAHPDYLSTQYAKEIADHSPRPALVLVQHHLAHVLSCMAENEIEPPVLGISWDGTGYGLDDSVWGGEFFLITDEACVRAAHLRPFRLPGGDHAVKEPRRSAFGLLFEIFGERALARREIASVRSFSTAEAGTVLKMLERRINSPVSSSAGRLFDGVASLIGLRQEAHFEGQAALELEFLLEEAGTDEAYPLPFLPGTAAGPGPSGGVLEGPGILDWAPLIRALLADCESKVSLGLVSARFHNALAEGITAVARHFAQPKVALSGGCFQNRYLTERVIQKLRQEGFQVYWHQRLPPNDGGISLGQIVAARKKLSLSGALPPGA